MRTLEQVFNVDMYIALPAYDQGYIFKVHLRFDLEHILVYRVHVFIG